jgi:hypothetical protein
MTRYGSLSDPSSASDSFSVVALSCMHIWSDEEAYASPEPLPASTSTCGASLGIWKDALSDSRSSVWKGLGGVKLAVR